MPPPPDNIFVFIRQVAPVPACWLFKTSATTWPFDLESGVRVACANFSLPRPLCSRVTPDIRDRRQTDRRQASLNASAVWGGGIINKKVSVTAASGSAGTDVLRHCDLNDLSRTAVESQSNRGCNQPPHKWARPSHLRWSILQKGQVDGHCFCTEYTENTVRILFWQLKPKPHFAIWHVWPWLGPTGTRLVKL